jgi:hypothetical protein
LGVLEILLLVVVIVVGVLMVVGGVLLYRSVDKPPPPYPTQFGLPLLFHPLLSMNQSISQGAGKAFGVVIALVGGAAAFLALGYLVVALSNLVIGG